MSHRPDLLIDWCSVAAARYATSHWHYSRSMPCPPYNVLGCWEDRRFIGSILFSRGAGSNMLRPFGLTAIEGCELTRVALTDHATPVSRIVTIAIGVWILVDLPNFSVIPRNLSYLLFAIILPVTLVQTLRAARAGLRGAMISATGLTIMAVAIDRKSTRLNSSHRL